MFGLSTKLNGLLSWVSGFLPHIWGVLAFKQECLRFAQKHSFPEMTLGHGIARHWPDQPAESQEAQQSSAESPLMLLSHPWLAVWIPASWPPELLGSSPSQALLPPASQPSHFAPPASTWIMHGIPLVVPPWPPPVTGTESLSSRRKSLEILVEVPLAECC